LVLSGLCGIGNCGYPSSRRRARADGAPLFVEVLRAENVKKTDVFGESDPYVTVSLRETPSAKAKRVDGSVKAKWPTVKDDKNPCWYSTSFVGRSARGDHGLHVKLWDEDRGSDDFLGEVCVPLRTMPDGIAKQLIIYPPGDEKNEHAQVVEVRVRRSFPSVRKKLILIRHGESEWNDAQSNNKFRVMLARVDHPLTAVGVDQALGLAKHIETAQREGSDDPCVNDLLSAQVVYSSPLCRAVQTALLGCAPLAAARPSLSWVLRKNAREKRNLGGRDSSGQEYGDKMARCLHDEVAELASMHVEEGGDGALLDEAALHRLVDGLDFRETATRWWQDTREDGDDAASRARQLFFHQVLWDERDAIVIVGHSHFFREFFAGHFSAGMTARVEVGETEHSARDWKKKKLSNCGVAHVVLDFAAIREAWREGRQPKEEEYRCIDDVTLLFDTKLVS